MPTFVKKLATLLILIVAISQSAQARDWGANLQYQWLLGDSGAQHRSSQHNGWQLQLSARPETDWQRNATQKITLPLHTRWLTIPEPLKVNGRVVQQVAVLLCGITAIAITVRAVIGKDDKNN